MPRARRSLAALLIAALASCQALPSIDLGTGGAAAGEMDYTFALILMIGICLVVLGILARR